MAGRQAGKQQAKEIEMQARSMRKKALQAAMFDVSPRKYTGITYRIFDQKVDGH